MLRPHLVWVWVSFLVLSACGMHSDGQAEPAAQKTLAPPEVARKDTEILGVVWEWVSTLTPVERVEVQAPERYTLRLKTDGNAAIQFDCNQGGGSYKISANRITFGPMISTRKACLPGSQDALFKSQLEKISSYFVRDGSLFLEMQLDSGTMRFRQARNKK